MKPTPEDEQRAAQWLLRRRRAEYGDDDIQEIAVRSLAALLAEVRAEERERCAKIADIHNSHVAAAIRRGT